MAAFDDNAIAGKVFPQFGIGWRCLGRARTQVGIAFNSETAERHILAFAAEEESTEFHPLPGTQYIAGLADDLQAVDARTQHDGLCKF